MSNQWPLIEGPQSVWTGSEAKGSSGNLDAIHSR